MKLTNLLILFCGILAAAGCSSSPVAPANQKEGRAMPQGSHHPRTPAAVGSIFDRFAVTCSRVGFAPPSTTVDFYIKKEGTALRFFLSKAEYRGTAQCSEDTAGFTCRASNGDGIRLDYGNEDKPMQKHGLYPSAVSSFADVKYRQHADLRCWFLSDVRDLDRFHPGF